MVLINTLHFSSGGAISHLPNVSLALKKSIALGSRARTFCGFTLPARSFCSATIYHYVKYLFFFCKHMHFLAEMQGSCRESAYILTKYNYCKGNCYRMVTIRLQLLLLARTLSPLDLGIAHTHFQFHKKLYHWNILSHGTNSQVQHQ